MAKLPTEHIRDLTARISVLEERDEARRAAMEEFKSLIRQQRDEQQAAEGRARAESAGLRQELAEVRQESAQ